MRLDIVLAVAAGMIGIGLPLWIAYHRGYDDGMARGFREGREYNERILPK